MSGIAIELLGGPLDGLQLAIPLASDEIRFPVFDNAPEFLAKAMANEPVRPDFHHLIYRRGADEHHYAYAGER